VALSKVDCTGCVDGYFLDTLPNGENIADFVSTTSITAQTVYLVPV
jgi:hypothetical protein